ncbi:3' terminal RNA ribose 2'-O-methyltransferase Hen1 [Cellulosimicrobium cellulans]|uniref:3' terminal RNA ribose 2'-O-methyltransferase Hen1 n=1 Tax=Cellulosimicrobium cellulans TaxID=1710 RepID=UPI001964A13C|nr:3' terminal RNA ribose 2'-O-methyltransferase Hen1 [Cellulosimicrobium cellulans]MBN0041714.1 3' terminal RNA ribose 2'-O-methyltransferase Hen1 [Cellulosimicrobium cellulans]
MLVTLAATASPGTLDDATDLGFLLHKHPDRAQVFDLPVGRAHVFYPEATAERCEVALLLEVDPVGIVRNKRFGGGDAFALAQYVNDRPYAASSMVAVALGKVFATAMAGRCDARPDLPAVELPLDVHVPSLPCRGGADLACRLFEPLGWHVTATTEPLDPTVPAWGASRYVDLRLRGTRRLADALAQLYVLLPVLDDAKHYWVSTDEVDKLVRAGGGWLADHPEREQILRRYLAHQRRYVEDATARLAALDGAAPAEEQAVPDSGVSADGAASPEADAPEPPLARQRADAVLGVLHEVGARTVVDLGCGEGALLRRLAADRTFTRVLGTDVSARELERAATRLRLHDASDAERERVRLLQSSLTYTDDRVRGFDAAVLMEVVEHVDPSRLHALAHAVLGHARPRAVVVTTPNAEYNVHYPNLLDGPGGSRVRHPDHRFEWTRAELRAWAGAVAERYGYAVEHRDVGPLAPDVGAPTQMVVLTLVPGADTPQGGTATAGSGTHDGGEAR